MDSKPVFNSLNLKAKLSKFKDEFDEQGDAEWLASLAETGTFKRSLFPNAKRISGLSHFPKDKCRWSIIILYWVMLSFVDI